jgi:hypothetical protein
MVGESLITAAQPAPGGKDPAGPRFHPAHLFQTHLPAVREGKGTVRKYA